MILSAGAMIDKCEEFISKKNNTFKVNNSELFVFSYVILLLIVFFIILFTGGI